MVCIWSTPSQLPRKVYKLYPIWLVSPLERPRAASVPKWTIWAASRITLSYTRQVSPWGLQNCISYCMMLPLPWWSLGWSKNGYRISNVQFAKCWTTTWDLYLQQTSLCLWFATKAQAQPKCFCLTQSIPKCWRKASNPCAGWFCLSKKHQNWLYGISSSQWMHEQWQCNSRLAWHFIKPSKVFM